MHSAKVDIKLSTISYIILYVRDTAKSLEFYRDTLGLTVKHEEESWVELNTGAATLALHKDDSSHVGNGKAIVVFGVDNINGTYEALKQTGINIARPPHVVCETPEAVGLSIDFQDPDGNWLSLYGMQNK